MRAESTFTGWTAVIVTKLQPLVVEVVPVDEHVVVLRLKHLSSCMPVIAIQALAGKLKPDMKHVLSQP